MTIEIIMPNQIAECDFRGSLMSVRKMRRGYNRNAAHAQELTEEEITNSANQLLIIAEGLEELSLEKQFSLVNIRAESKNDQDPFDRFLFLPSSSDNIYVHAVTARRRAVIEDTFNAGSVEKKIELRNNEYGIKYSLIPPLNSLSLFTYDKQTGKVRDSFKIMQFILEHSDLPLGLAGLSMLKTNSEPLSEDDSIISSKSLMNALASMKKSTILSLAKYGFTANEENIADYIDFACILKGDVSFLSLAFKIKEMLEEEGQSFCSEDHTSYLELVTTFMRRSWSPDFLYSVEVNSVEITSLVHLDALYNIWSSSPKEWYYRYIDAS